MQVNDRKQTAEMVELHVYADLRGSRTDRNSGAAGFSGSTGNVYIKKKTKKGTYRIQIQVSASGDSEYNAGSSTVTCSIKVK